MIIAITGGMGSGKSTVSSILRREGYFVFDCDKASREVVKRGSEGLSKLIDVFGPEILTKDGRLNRRRLARIAFSDENKTELLNDIVQSAIKEELHKVSAKHLSRSLKPFFAEIPLIFEAKWEDEADRIWLVTADEQTRIQRIKERDKNLTEDDIRARLALQMSDKEKALRSDLVIDNSGSLKDLKKKVMNAVDGLVIR